MNEKIIFFDLEGPLSPQDNAYEVMSLIPDGKKIFEIISRYDDILTIEKRENYYPGDTLKLIVPFLLLHGIKDDDIKKISDKSTITKGAKQLCDKLKTDKFQIYIISTSYEQHAKNIACMLGINEENVICTEIDKYLKKFENYSFSSVKKIEEKIFALYEKMDDATIKKILDEFFFNKIKKQKIGDLLDEITVIGGMRKKDAIKKIIYDKKLSINNAICVGDSITDIDMLRYLKENNGLSIVFNGNEYAIPHGVIAVASESLYDVYPIIEAWSEGRLKKIKKLCREKSPFIHFIDEEKNIDKIIEIHKEMRKKLRGEAGKLG